MKRTVLIAAALVAVLHLPATALEVVKYAGNGGGGDAPLYIAKELGLFRDEGLEVDIIKLDSPPTMLAGVASGNIQIAGIAITPGFFSSVERGIALKLVGTKTTGFSALKFVVSNNLAKTDAKMGLDNLKGKRIAITSKASSNYFLLQELLRTNGLNISDVQVFEMGFSSMPSGLSSGAIDGAIMFEPFISQTIAKGLGFIASGFDELAPSGGVAWLVYSEGFAGDKKNAKAFMRAYVKAIRIYNDAFLKDKNRNQIVEIIARGAEVPKAVVEQSIPVLIDPNQSYDDSYLHAAQRFFLENGYLEKPADISRLKEWQFVEEIISELGRY